MKPSTDVIVKALLQMSLRELRAIQVVLKHVIEHVEYVELTDFKREAQKDFDFKV